MLLLALSFDRAFVIAENYQIFSSNYICFIEQIHFICLYLIHKHTIYFVCDLFIRFTTISVTSAWARHDLLLSNELYVNKLE